MDIPASWEPRFEDDGAAAIYTRVDLSAKRTGDLRIETPAKVAELSPSHFFRAFRQTVRTPTHFGYTAISYSQQRGNSRRWTPMMSPS